MSLNDWHTLVHHESVRRHHLSTVASRRTRDCAPFSYLRQRGGSEDARWLGGAREGGTRYTDGKPCAEHIAAPCNCDRKKMQDSFAGASLATNSVPLLSVLGESELNSWRRPVQKLNVAYAGSEADSSGVDRSVSAGPSLLLTLFSFVRTTTDLIHHGGTSLHVNLSSNVRRAA